MLLSSEMLHFQDIIKMLKIIPSCNTDQGVQVTCEYLIHI